MHLLNEGFDHIEFVVDSIDQHKDMYSKMGFEQVGESHLPEQGLRSVLMAQGHIRIKLTRPEDTKSHEGDFLRSHGDGVCVLALEVEDAKATFEAALAKGARPARDVKRFEAGGDEVIRAEVWTPGDIRYAFMQRNSKKLFDEGLEISHFESPRPCHLRRVDHLTNNVSIGEMQGWVDYYKDKFDFKVTRHFDIKAGRTGLTSDVVESQDRKVKVPINEATEPESQVQEFCDRFNGAGVQHLAFETDDIMATLRDFRSKGFKFLNIPSTYYEDVPKRVPVFDEDLKELEELGILLDGEGEGYLLQIFTEEMVGPFFFEFIQRKGNQGFGEGNFQALFEAIERDQVRRGVLK